MRALGGWAIVAVWSAALVVIDVRRRRLPNVLTLPGAAIITVWALGYEPVLIMGGVAWALLYFLIALRGNGLGGGDIKLAFSLGTLAATTGVVGWFAVVLGSSLITLVVLIITRKSAMAHGPSMFAAFWVTLLIHAAW